MKSVAVLQARTNSSRLPGKVLLPINFIPLVVLAAKRASNTGRDVIVATSREATDDVLSEVLQNYGIRCFRGSLHNTLERVVAALNEYSDDTLVFRLTGDNVFPDGSLLDEMEADFLQRGLDYLCCNGEGSGLPYGMSAEVTRLLHLRKALQSTTARYDLEHVTPYIRRSFGDVFFDKYKELGKGHYRCTVDCFDDYITVQKVFSTVDDPVQEPALNLIKRLDAIKYQPSQPKPATKLVVGAAQLGLSYGIANESGKPDQQLAETIIKTAIGNGASYIDTAHAYGDSESVIGAALKDGWAGRVRVVTKLSPLAQCPGDATPEVINAFVDASIYKSCAALRMQSLDVLLLHRASHMRLWDGAVWERLLEHKKNGTLNALGVSVQNADELEFVLDIPEVEVVQMPLNILDWRWDHLQSKILARKHSSGLTIHVRSALLQGLLPSTNSAHWNKANVLSPELIIQWLEQQRLNTDSASVAELCLRYVNSIDWVDGVVVGMESLSQLQENVKIFCRPTFPAEVVANLRANRPILDESTLNPALWR